jgi:excinuclease UvrABC helicase subunit UvrB
MTAVKTSDAYRPTGDKPEAIETLAAGLRAGVFSSATRGCLRSPKA